MTIFILRHGQAEAQITSDEARQLTAKGRADCARVLAARAEDLSVITQIWASPLVRAQQTAEIAAGYFPALRVQTTALLIPEASPRALLDWLQSTAATESILLVSHQPLVGKLLDTLCGKADGYHPMGTSSLAAVDTELVASGLGRLRWLDQVN